MSQWQQGIVKTVLFPCPAPSYTIDSFPGELVWIPQVPSLDLKEGGPQEGAYPDGSDPAEAKVYGEPVPCLLLPYESARFLIIFFHSNAEDLGRCRWFCHFLRDQFQVHVMAVEYPGYGICSGPPSREGVIANAHAALQFAMQALKLPLEQIKLFGRSIGTGPALQLASRFKVAGVVLVTPFINVKRLFSERVGPLAVFVDEWFDNDAAIKQVSSPTMIVHGKKDVIIPWHHSEALYKNCWARKVFVNPAGMEHNTNLTSDISYLIVPMFRFFSLPDYSFEELNVPHWAKDKRRSPLYVRPKMEVCSHKDVPVVGAGPAGLASPVPAGDDTEDLPLDQELQLSQKWESKSSTAAGEAIALTHPTVRHAYRATKMRYDFTSPVKIGSDCLEGSEVEERPPGHSEALRRKTLGNHQAASMPAEVPGLLPSTPAKPADSGLSDGPDPAASPASGPSLADSAAADDGDGPRKPRQAEDPGPEPEAFQLESLEAVETESVPNLPPQTHKPEFAPCSSPAALLQQATADPKATVQPLQINSCPI